ncbi:MAG: LytTR family DNA-binding domain-containing protein [Oscillospiraceae bacterium]
MLNVAICDDDIAELAHVTVLLDEYKLDRHVDVNHTAFQSPLELLASIEKGALYDILLLDVIMPGLDGISTAKEIRLYDKNVQIIFLTSSSEFAVESYVVGAYFYQLKPVWKESFFTLMDNVSLTLTKKQNESFIVRCSTGITRILIRQLICCEVMNRTLLYHLSDNMTLTSIGSMRNIEQALQKYPCFLKAHRSFLVNMNFIKNISYQEIELENQMKIPIPRGKYSELKEIFLAYAFEGGNHT